MLILPTQENLDILRAAYLKIVTGASVARAEYDTDSGRRSNAFFKGDVERLAISINQMAAELDPTIPKAYGTLTLRTRKGL